MTILTNCDFRLVTPEEGHYRCHHRRLRSHDGIVAEEVCATCELERSGREWDGRLHGDEHRLGCALPSCHTVEQNVTVGITAFKRPESLQRLVGSIRHFYPHIRIVVADNGDEPADLDVWSVDYRQLEFNCGLSASRNVLIAACETEFLLICEDDFEFTDETKIERFLDVLDGNNEIGLVGGALWTNSELLDYATDLEVFRSRLTAVRARGAQQFTSNGTAYRQVDMTFNFCLCRTEMLQDYPWDNELRLCEHTEYFLRIKKGEQWRVAFTDHVRCIHHKTRNAGYDSYRRAVKKYFRRFQREYHLAGTHIPLAQDLPNRSHQQPNIVLFGVGHSGTSVVTRMLFSMGWNGGRCPEDVDPEFAEHVDLRWVNDQMLSGHAFPTQMASRLLKRLPAPWVVKDPRFVHTIEHWRSVLAPYEPVLLWLVRDVTDVKNSYRRRSHNVEPEPRSRGRTIDQLVAQAGEIYANWPWAKMRLQYEQIQQAVRHFDPDWQHQYEPSPFSRSQV